MINLFKVHKQRFRDIQDSKVPGLSIVNRFDLLLVYLSSSVVLGSHNHISNITFNRKQRKNRNLVTMKFNMINWVLETFSTILVLMKVNRIFYILYLFVNATGTPLVYYLGIEENRKSAKEYFKSNIREDFL